MLAGVEEESLARNAFAILEMNGAEARACTGRDHGSIVAATARGEHPSPPTPAAGPPQPRRMRCARHPRSCKTAPRAKRHEHTAVSQEAERRLSHPRAPKDWLGARPAPPTAERSEQDARDWLTDLATAHSEYADASQTPERHKPVAAVVLRILAGKDGVGH
jgi:hypothetical protein